MTAAWSLEDWESGAVPPCLTVDETAVALQVSKWTVYDRVRRGELPTVAHRAPIRIPTVAVRRLLGIGNPTQDPQ